MLCKDIMCSPVRSVSEEDTVQVVAGIMAEQNIGFVPVHDFSGRFVGSITDRGLAVRVVAEGLPSGTKIALVMTREAIACRPEDTIEIAEQTMMRHHKSRIVCTNESGYIEGVISIGDLATNQAEARVGKVVKRISERSERH